MKSARDSPRLRHAAANSERRVTLAFLEERKRGFEGRNANIAEGSLQVGRNSGRTDGPGSLYPAYIQPLRTSSMTGILMGWRFTKRLRARPFDEPLESGVSTKLGVSGISRGDLDTASDTVSGKFPGPASTGSVRLLMKIWATSRQAPRHLRAPSGDRWRHARVPGKASRAGVVAPKGPLVSGLLSGRRYGRPLARYPSGILFRRPDRLHHSTGPNHRVNGRHGLNGGGHWFPLFDRQRGGLPPLDEASSVDRSKGPACKIAKGGLDRQFVLRKIVARTAREHDDLRFQGGLR